MTWIEYYRELCKTIALKSKDCHKVGSILVDKERHIILGQGYNGAPTGKYEEDIEWSKSGLSSNKHQFVIHSEINAVLNCPINIKTYNGKIICYATLAPCPECLKFLVQAGIQEIYYWEKWSLTDKSIELAHRYNVIYEQLPN